MKEKAIPNLSSRAFWSGKIQNKEGLFTEMKEGIVVNVFENGSYDDMIELLVYYGTNEVIRILKIK